MTELTLHEAANVAGVSFEDALDDFINALNKATEANSLTFNNMHYSETDEEAYFRPMEQTRGKKYVKLISLSGSSRSVYCFVRIEDGAILKSAGWSAPAKGERGNIYAKSWEGKNLAYGSWLYR